jgi:hypothetical protein
MDVLRILSVTAPPVIASVKRLWLRPVTVDKTKSYPVRTKRIRKSALVFQLPAQQIELTVACIFYLA